MKYTLRKKSVKEKRKKKGREEREYRLYNLYTHISCHNYTKYTYKGVWSNELLQVFFKYSEGVCFLNIFRQFIEIYTARV